MAVKISNKPKTSYVFTVSNVLRVIFFITTLINISDSTLCLNSSFSNNGTNIAHNYTCPGKEDPRSHSECCSSFDVKVCCPRARYFYEIDKTLASLIAISVVSTCFILTVLIAVCCFWSRCPLYSSCRVEFTHDIATYVSKEDSIDMDGMPTEFSGKANNKFSPVVVSNGNLPLDSDNNPI